MLLMVTFGVMNIGAMVGLAVVIAVEKVWRHGEAFARFVGVGCLVFAVVLVFEPGLAPGLDPDAVMPMTDMNM
jgi:predicted metal-binding membrane protein